LVRQFCTEVSNALRKSADAGVKRMRRQNSSRCADGSAGGNACCPPHSATQVSFIFYSTLEIHHG